MADALQVMVNGLAVGFVYALILLGLLLTYRVTKVANLAHGQFGMLAGLGAYYLLDKQAWGLWTAVSIGILAAGVAGVFTKYLTDLLPWDLHERGGDLVLTLGVFLLLSSLGENVLHNEAAAVFPDLVSMNIRFAGVFVNGHSILIVALTSAIFAATYYVLIWTRFGTQARAVAENPSIAESVGLNVGSIRAAAWLIAGLLGGLAGVMASTRVPVDAFYMTPFLIKAFIAGILGGLHRFVAPIMVAVGLGLVENWVGFFFGAQYRIVATYGLAILVLAVAPKRILSPIAEARA